MEKADLIIYNAGQIATCRSPGRAKKGSEMLDAGVLLDAGIAVNAGKIRAVGKSSEILKNFESEISVDAEGGAVVPGFVECHTHLVYAGDRLDEFELKIKGADYLEILEAGGGILSTVEKTRKAEFETLLHESKTRLDKMLAHGVTTCEVKTGYGLDLETELKMLRAILELDRRHPCDVLPTVLGAHAVPPEFKENPDGFVDLVCRALMPAALRVFLENSPDESEKEFEKNIGLDEFTSHELTEVQEKIKEKPIFIDVFCEKNAFDLAQTKKILETGKNLGYRLKAHVDEFTNLGGARLAIELGAVSIDHLDRISSEEIDLLASSETIGVVTPTVNFNFGAKEFADARRLIDRGCAVAVSTDFNPGSAPCPSMPNALAISCRYQKILPAEALNAATVNAAYAVASGKKCGSIEPGKNADFLILEASDFREIAYEFGGNLVKTVFKKGEIVGNVA